MVDRISLGLFVSRAEIEEYFLWDLVILNAERARLEDLRLRVLAGTWRIRAHDEFVMISR